MIAHVKTSIDLRPSAATQGVAANSYDETEWEIGWILSLGSKRSSNPRERMSYDGAGHQRSEAAYPLVRGTEPRDVARVGGKNASLGEMVRNLSKKGVHVPAGTIRGMPPFPMRNCRGRRA